MPYNGSVHFISSHLTSFHPNSEFTVVSRTHGKLGCAVKRSTQFAVAATNHSTLSLDETRQLYITDFARCATHDVYLLSFIIEQILVGINEVV